MTITYVLKHKSILNNKKNSRTLIYHTRSKGVCPISIKDISSQWALLSRKMRTNQTRLNIINQQQKMFKDSNLPYEVQRCAPHSNNYISSQWALLSRKARRTNQTHLNIINLPSFEAKVPCDINSQSMKYQTLSKDLTKS
jgi:hypothetical protein